MIVFTYRTRRCEAGPVFIGRSLAVMRGLPYRANAVIMIDVRQFMNTYFYLSPKARHMNNDIVIGSSNISGRGVFARRAFRKSEIVLRWDVSQKIRRDNIESLPLEQRHFLNPFDDEFFVLLGGSPNGM
jgi:hypothetical protein